MYGIELLDMVVPGYGFFYLAGSRVDGLDAEEVVTLTSHLDRIGVEYDVWRDGPGEEAEIWQQHLDEYELQSDWFGEPAVWVLDEAVDTIMFLGRRGLL